MKLVFIQHFPFSESFILNTIISNKNACLKEYVVDFINHLKDESLFKNHIILQDGR